ncbi:MAG: YCF48-related protein [Pseudomonadota bacterium]
MPGTQCAGANRRLAPLLLLAVATATAQEAEPESASAPFNSSQAAAEGMTRASESLLLDICDTGSGLVAVGERGHILRSSDGAAWEQVADVPTRSTLTALECRGNLLWTAGHDQVILHSRDGGVSWEQQYASPDVFDPEANSPLLDITFISDSNGFAVGAYAIFLRSTDGGATWEPDELTLASDTDDEAADDKADDADEAAEDDPYAFDYDAGFDDFIDYHLNNLVQMPGGDLYLAAERGNGFRSRDQGATWEALQLPYGGSMFGALPLSESGVLTFGLRGNLFVSDDLGDSWTQLNNSSLNSLNGGARLADGRVVLVGVNGELLVVDGERLSSQLHENGDDFAAAVVRGDTLVLVGEGGVTLQRLEELP